MRKTIRFAVLAIVVLSFAAIFSVGAFAQAHELAVTIGGNFPKNDQYNPGNSFAVGAQYDGRIIHVPLASLYVDLPFVVATKSTFSEPSTIFCPVTNPSCSLRNSYRSYYFTPGLKVKLAPEFPVSPYFVAGVGFAHYNTVNSTFIGNNSSTKAAYEVGGGIDWKIAPFVSARAEVRDFINGTPDIATITQTGHQHNVVPQVGLVLRF